MVCVQRHDRGKTFVARDELTAEVPRQLQAIQQALLEAAEARQEAATFTVDSYDDFKAKLADPGGFLLAHWCGDAACETRIKDETQATIRCLALDQPQESGACVLCGGSSERRAHFAKAY